MKSLGVHRSDQSEVWKNIDEKFQKLAAMSPTSAMSEIFDQHTAKLSEYERSFAPGAGQVGMMFAIDGRIIGFDLFDCPETLRKLFPKLIRSYALDALDASMAKKPVAKIPSAEDAFEFLNRVGRAKQENFPAIGEGEDIRFSEGDLTGAALSKKGHVVHLSAFHLAEGTGRKPTV
jgi:ARG and Rhodanese-Phosphatase-superfamily-associated Protein domain